MNKIIKEQLNKCIVAQIPNFDDDTLILQIPKTISNNCQSVIEFNQGRYYNIEVEDYIIHPYDGFTLHDNWNQGKIPTDKIMQCEVLQVMGKMIKIKSTNWEGWLPIKSCKILNEVR